jgi:hypothetical protein
VSRLKSELGGGQWAYVHNAAGGFYGFFGKRVPVAGCNVYLQVEASKKQNKLCFNIDVREPGEQKLLGDMWHKRVIGEAQETRYLRCKAWPHARRQDDDRCEAE